MASGGGKNKKGVIYWCSCSEELEEDDQVLAIKCSAGHYIYARNPKVADRSKVLVYVFCSKRIVFRAILKHWELRSLPRVKHELETANGGAPEQAQHGAA